MDFKNVVALDIYTWRYVYAYIRVCVYTHNTGREWTQNVGIKKTHTHTLEYHSTTKMQEMLPRDNVNGP